MQNDKSGNPALSCLRCNKNSEEVSVQGNILVRIENSAICSGCTKEINKLAKEVKVPEFNPQTVSSEKSELKAMTVEKNLVTPLSILEQLNEYVIGQEQAKKAMASVLANHYYRMQGQKLRKTNLLLIGPTGTGKTELAKAASKILNVPFTIFDSTEATCHGFVGINSEECLSQLIQCADGDVKKAQCGIVFLDEIDKIAEQDSNSHISTTAVQQNMLKMLEGKVTSIPVKGKSSPSNSGETILFDTSKVLFIASGAFSGLDRLVNSDTKNRGSIGINAKINSKNLDSDILYNQVETKHLIQYGLIPEFIGRFQKLAFTQTLSIESLTQILTGSKNSIVKHYKNILKNINMDVEFSDEFLKSIAVRAFHSELGARGLERIFESEMDKNNLLFTKVNTAGPLVKIKI